MARIKKPIENSFKDDIDAFQRITEDMLLTFSSKNADYGNAFEEALDNPKLGLTYAAGIIYNKAHRFVNLHNKNESKVGESIDDTLLDLANYCVLTLLWRRKQRK